MHGPRILGHRRTKNWIERNPHLRYTLRLEESDTMSGGQEYLRRNQCAATRLVQHSGSYVLSHNGANFGVTVVVESTIGDTECDRRRQCDSNDQSHELHISPRGQIVSAPADWSTTGWQSIERV